MTLRAQSPRFEEWLFEPNALVVDILPRLHVVNGVDHQIQITPKTVIEDVLLVRTHSKLVGCEFRLRVHLLPYLASCHTLAQTHVLPSEEELPV